MSQQPQRLPDILSLLQSNSDNAIALSITEWEALFKALTDQFIQSTKSKKNVDSGILLLKIFDMLTFQFLEVYAETDTRHWGDAHATKARLEIYILDSIAMFASHSDAETLNNTQSTKTIIARILSYLLAKAQLQEVPQLAESNDAQLTLPTPTSVREHAVQTLAAIIKSLSNGIFPSQYLDCKADTIRDLLQKVIDVISEMTDTLSNPILPAYFTFVNLSPPVVKESTSFDLFSEADEQPRICIKDTFQLLTTLHDLTELLARCLDGVSHWSLEIFYREAVQSISRIAFALISGELEGLGHTGVAMLNVCVSSLHTLAKHRMCTRHKETLSSVMMHVLRFRLRNGPKSTWEDFDTALLRSLDDHEAHVVTAQMVSGIIEALVNEEWGPEGEQLRQCSYSSLMSVTDKMSSETAHQYFHALSQKPRSNRLVQLLSALDKRRIPSEVEPQHRRAHNNTSYTNPAPRKDSIIHAVLPSVPEGDYKDRLIRAVDDDTEFLEWSTRAVLLLKEAMLHAIQSDRVNNTDIASTLSLLPCLFNHPLGTTHCKGASRTSTLPILDLLMACTEVLFEKTDDDSQEAVRRHALDAIAKCVRHQALHLKDGSVVMVVLQNMEHGKRTVRLAAGRALVEVLELDRSLSGNNQSHDSTTIFNRIHELLSGDDDPVKETTVVTLGLAGRSQSMHNVEHIISMLVVQLGQSNILVRSTAFTQAISISRHHSRTPYSLALPNLGRIVHLTLSSASRYAFMLNEICRLFITTAENLISSTLPEVLPRLFAECNEIALNKLEIILNRSTASLLSDHIGEVLVGLFMLDEEGSQKSLRFLRNHIKSRTSNDFDPLDALKDYLWKVLADLVIVMGHEDLEHASAATDGVRRLLRLLKQEEGYEYLDPENVGSIFVDNLLGIVTHLNDGVQNARKSHALRIRILRGLGMMISEVKGQIVSVAPQIMATLQTTIRSKALSEETLSTWNIFIHSLEISDLGAIVGQTSASIVDAWSLLTNSGRRTGKEILEFIVIQRGSELGDHIIDVTDLSNIPELSKCADKLRTLRTGESAKTTVYQLMRRMQTDNMTVISQSLEELRACLTETNESFIRDMTSGNVFDPTIGLLFKSLLTIACRGGENRAHLRSLAFECIGILGAVDPDRFDIPHHESSVLVINDFTDESESMHFAMHLIQEILIGAYRSTSDIGFQSEVAYAIQELLKVCGFTVDLVVPGGVPVPLKVRARWSKLPKYVLDTVTPLLASKYALPDEGDYIASKHPIYDQYATYREWIQHWASHLISKATGNMARRIFRVFKAVVRNNDVGVTQQILPHVALNVLMSGSDEDITNMRAEITSVLEDQLNDRDCSSIEKKRSSAQLIFTLMDHFNKWLYHARREIASRRQEAGASTSTRRSRQPQTTLDMQVLRVDSILANIDQNLLAQAAFKCASYARSLMNYEKHILMKHNAGVSSARLQDCYERLHEIYSHLDEPDGMEGISACIVIPSLEHHIRQHESTGHWTSAQSCWEIRLQQSPDNLDHHIGLLRCLRNLGHYDSLRTHVQGVLVRNPTWEEPLASFRVEGALMASDWATVSDVVSQSTSRSSEVALARVFLAMRSGDEVSISDALALARTQMGEPITTAGERGYRRAYEAILSLHILQDIRIIHESSLLKGSTQSSLENLRNVLDSRFEATLPSFRIREPILNMHRVAFSLSSTRLSVLKRDIGRSWLSSAKIARKAGQWQTAYSAVLQAKECNAPLSFIQSAKLIKATGEPLRALYELTVALHGLTSDQTDDLSLTQPEAHARDRMIAKAKILRARWMRESERYDSGVVLKELIELVKANPDMESAYFHAGHFQDELYNNLSKPDKKSRGQYMVIFTVKQYARSLRFGSKYTYQTVPRILTLWLDMGEDQSLSSTDTFAQINKEIDSAIRHTPVYKWLTAFPQVVSRVDHRNNQAYAILSKLILTVMQEHPQQSLWLFMSCVKSTKSRRERRGTSILEQLKSNPQNNSTKVPALVQQAFNMATELLRLCDAPIRDNDIKTLSMARDFPLLKKQAPSDLIIPLQESLTVNLPPTSSQISDHQPFPSDAPLFYQFLDEIDIMKSLARPRKITIVGTNSEHYIFLGKPKDDLRKDARLMDFNAIINKLLRSNSDSRRRRLRIRTYSVVTLNEECGFIQWVPDTIPIRPVLVKYYSAKGIDSWKREWGITFQRIKETSDKDAAKIFKEEILKLFPCVFHQWFLDQFPEPTAWLSSRLAYGRTIAVMSMVGFILGLGDRHLENILLDVTTGDIVHVDFNCLFERGKTLDTPERVPFRLTQNLVDGLGVTGVEGVYRIACEITMKLLRANKDILMNVLDAFIHDPLVEWEDEKRKREKQARNNSSREAIDPRRFAKEALEKIRQKLQGMYVRDSSPNERRDKEIATNNLVQMLIEEATDLKNLAKMYPGWAPWH